MNEPRLAFLCVHDFLYVVPDVVSPSSCHSVNPSGLVYLVYAFLLWHPAYLPLILLLCSIHHDRMETGQ